jgi:hypothetical protein
LAIVWPAVTATTPLLSPKQHQHHHQNQDGFGSASATTAATAAPAAISTAYRHYSSSRVSLSDRSETPQNTAEVMFAITTAHLRDSCTDQNGADAARESSGDGDRAQAIAEINIQANIHTAFSTALTSLRIIKVALRRSINSMRESGMLPPLFDPMQAILLFLSEQQSEQTFGETIKQHSKQRGEQQGERQAEKSPELGLEIGAPMELVTGSDNGNENDNDNYNGNGKGNECDDDNNVNNVNDNDGSKTVHEITLQEGTNAKRHTQNAFLLNFLLYFLRCSLMQLSEVCEIRLLIKFK